ncbi:DUF2973 domain-containing protein [Pleurocapsales cyanobacterium LEGE 06147]|nr:DUF2973 domain-containing protein [Pleurocapsales cyanobacterium LEGE 06147]
MLHLVYILAFTTIAFIAISNLIRSLITLSAETQRVYPSANQSSQSNNRSQVRSNSRSPREIHPELLDEQGRVINEPLLVMRSVSVEDAREQLDSIFNSSPNKSDREE